MALCSAERMSLESSEAMSLEGDPFQAGHFLQPRPRSTDAGGGVLASRLFRDCCTLS